MNPRCRKTSLHASTAKTVPAYARRAKAMLGSRPGNAVSRTTNCHKDDWRREPSLAKPKYRAAGWTVRMEKATGKQTDGTQWVEACEVRLTIATCLHPAVQEFGSVFCWMQFASQEEPHLRTQFSARTARLCGISTQRCVAPCHECNDLTGEGGSSQTALTRHFDHKKASVHSSAFVDIATFISPFVRVECI